jgi:cell division protein FtsL
VLLAGIVALNVAVLRLNMTRERLDAQREQLRADNEDLASQLSSATALGRVEAIARRKLGLGPPAETTYVRLRKR